MNDDTEIKTLKQHIQTLEAALRAKPRVHAVIQKKNGINYTLLITETYYDPREGLTIYVQGPLKP